MPTYQAFETSSPAVRLPTIPSQNTWIILPPFRQFTVGQKDRMSRRFSISSRTVDSHGIPVWKAWIKIIKALILYTYRRCQTVTFLQIHTLSCVRFFSSWTFSHCHSSESTSIFSFLFLVLLRNLLNPSIYSTPSQHPY